MILPLLAIYMYRILVTNISALKQVILDQSGQNGYQTVSFDVYIHNLIDVYFSIGIRDVI